MGSLLDALLIAFRKVTFSGSPVTQPAGTSPSTVLNFTSGATGQYNSSTGAIDVAITAATPAPFLLLTLRNTSPAGATDVKFVDGYYTAGDGGGGYFEWVASSTANDDGGTIIQVTGTPTGRWIRRYTDQWLNGLWFGMQATGRPSSGGFDNTAAFTACINAANVQGKHIFLPPIPAGYGFAASAAATDPLPALTTCTGIIGGTEGYESILDFDNCDGSCLKVRGGSNIVRGIQVVNRRTSALTNASACVHLMNLTGVRGIAIHAAQGATNNSSVMLEQRMDWSQISNVQNVGGLVQITINYVDQNTSNPWTDEQKQHARPETGETWIVDNIGGSIGTSVNGLSWVIDVVSATGSSAVFTLRGSVASGSYTSGGSACRVLDSYLLAHVGTWHNNLDNLILTYLGVGANLGAGLNLSVNPACINVTNPLGQNAFFPFTKSGTVSFNRINGFDIEGNGDGVLFNGASLNVFTGGIFLGNGNQVHLTNSSAGNVFTGTYFDQWATKAINSDGTGHSNQFLGVQFFPSVTFGTDILLGATDVIYTANDNFSACTSRQGFASPDLNQQLLPVIYNGRTFWTLQNDLASGGANFHAWGPRADNSGLACWYPFPAAHTPTANNFGLQSNGNDLDINCPNNSGAGALWFSFQNTRINSLNSNGFGGNATSSGTPFKLQQQTKSVSGGTQALSAAETASPNISLTGTLTSDQTIQLPNALGNYWIDVGGLTLNGHNLILTSGSASTTVTTMITATKTMLTVITNPRGTNTMAVG